MNHNIIAIGASAGGLEALQDFLSHFPKNINNVSIIIAQHLSPTHKSMLVQLLGRETKLEVVEAVHGTEPTSNTVYITPPDAEIQFIKGKIALRKPSFSSGPKPSVDILFESLAECEGFTIIAVILSGTGTDGAQGIKAIKKTGGMVIVQDPSTSKYDGMPLASIETGLVDIITDPAKMGEKILDFLANPFEVRKSLAEEEAIYGTSLQHIFALLSKRYGTDFENYKPTTICRRISKRLERLSINTIDDYLGYIKLHPTELDELFKMILIGVTNFFRDTEAFQELEKLLKEILYPKSHQDVIRVWVAGCATGEEAYSIAILFAKLQTSNIKPIGVQIFATDIDDRAISIARRGIYPKSSIENVEASLVDDYFNHNGDFVEVKKNIRSMVLFSKHDLTNNPPFLKLDLISCRNLLIYFGAELQKQIIPLFHYALLPDKYLFLGKSETIGSFQNLFNMLDSKNKVFQRKPGNSLAMVRFSGLRARKQIQLNVHGSIVKEQGNSTSLKDLVKDTLFASFEHPYIVINDSFDIQEVVGDVRLYLSMPSGGMNINLLKFIHPDLLIELRSLLTQSLTNRSNAFGMPKRFMFFEKVFMVRMSVKPLLHHDKYPDMRLVVFEPIKVDEALEELPKPVYDQSQNQRIIELEQELAATKDHLQAYIEEIETSNEELQSLNEEMQSTNEELQSANEELETNNEELQSTNEELQIAYNELKVANGELQKKEVELQKANALFEVLFDNTQQGNLLLAKSFEILLMNHKAGLIINDIGSETPIAIGKNILEIIPDVLVNDFLPFLREAILSKDSMKKVFTIPREEKTLYLEFSTTPVRNSTSVDNAFINIGILDLTELYTKEAALFQKDEMLFSMLESNTTYLIRIDMHGNYTYINNSFCEKFGYSHEQLIGQHYAPTVHPDDIGACEKGCEKLFEKPGSVQTVELRKPNPAGGYFLTEWEFVAIRNKNGEVVEIQCMGRDITDARKAENLLKKERDHLEMIVKSGKLGTWDWDLKKDEIIFNKQWADMLGYAPIETKFNFNNWKDLIHPEDKDKVLDALNRCIVGQSDFYTVENRKIAKDASIKWILATGMAYGRDSHGKALQILGIHQDITPIKLVEEKARLSEERNTAILETMQEGIVIRNIDGKIVSCNNSATNILGIPYEQIIGLKTIDSIWNCIQEDGQPLSERDNPAMVALRTGKPVSSMVMGINKPDGSITWISINAQLLYNLGSTVPYGVFSTFVDISIRKKAQLELKKSEEILRASLEASLEAIYLLDVVKDQNGEVVDFTLLEVNKIGLGQMQVTREKAIGLQVRKAFSINETHGLFYKLKEVYLSKAPMIYEYSTESDCGNAHHYFQQVLPLANGVAVYNRDITEKVRIDRERSLLLERIEKIAEQSPDMIYEYCLQTDGKSYFPYCSPKVIDFFGVTPQQAALDATFLIECIHPEDSGKVMEAIQESVNNLSEWKIDFRIIHNNGNTIWVEGSSAPQKLENGDILWLGVLHNITERKKMIAELEKLSLLAKRTTNAVLFTDAERYTIWLNDGFTRLTGYTLEDMLGKKPGDLLQFNKTNTASIELMREKLSKPEPVTVEILNQSKEGKEYWVSLEIQPLFEQGKLSGFMSIEIDITERKLKEEEQNKLITQLTLTIDDLTQFSYIVSHNLRAPLANVLGLTSFLKNNPEDENQRDFLNMLDESAIKLDDVIKDLNGLLALRNKPYDYEQVSLRAILSDCKDLLGHSIEACGAKIEAEFNGVDLVFSVKPILLSIFYNLIGNAIKYAKENATPLINIKVNELENNIVYEFSDNGIGIDLTRHRNHIFGLYQRLNNIKEGKGIGLYLTRSNVKRLGGTITVDSEVGVGTCFKILLPKKI